MIPLFVRSRSQLLADIEALQRDTSNARWSEAEIVRAINRGVLDWGDRVLVPDVYTITATFGPNESEYTLPAYVQEPIDVQYQIANEDFWYDLPSYRVLPRSGTARVLSLDYYPPSGTARVIWWLRNGQLPLTAPALSSGISASDTSLTVNAAVDVGESGFVKIDQEWIRYRGITPGSSTTVLTNLVRGEFGTTAASHLSSATVDWGVAAHRADIFTAQLFHAVVSFLHDYYMTDAGNTEKEIHQWVSRRAEQRAEAYWRRWTPARPPKATLSRQATGDSYTPNGGRQRIPYRYP